jgi:predicted DNA-binding protein
MRKDRIFRLRMPTAEVTALKRVAKEKGQAASAYVRRVIAEEVRRDDAGRRVREALRSRGKGKLTDAEAMRLADEAKHATRSR